MISLIFATIISLPHTVVSPRNAAFIVEGQSNALDNGNVSNVPNVYVIRRNGQVDDEIGFGFPRYLATQYMQGNNQGFDQIWIISCAVSGSSITQWKPNQAPYDVCIANINQAINLGLNIRGILWHQGEKNAVSGLSNYKALLETHIDNIRSNVPSYVKFIAGELGRFLNSSTHPYRASIVNQTRNAILNRPKTAFVESVGLTDRGDNLHFDLESYEFLGIRYANAMIFLEQVE